MKLLMNMVFIITALMVIIAGLLYLFQEKLIFFPQKLSPTYAFSFQESFDEIKIRTNDGKMIHGILFKSIKKKGLVFYLHGNAGALDSWGDVAGIYTRLDYDVFMLDYRGYGKSEGAITSERVLHEDVQAAYDIMRTKYEERKIIILGYSIGTGMACKLASENHARLLIMQAPFYNFPDVAKSIYKVVPGFLLKYRFRTDKWIQGCKMPVILFHGNRDEVIYYGSSIKLKKFFKPTDRLITIDGAGHNGMSDHPVYLAEIRRILN